MLSKVTGREKGDLEGEENIVAMRMILKIF